MCERGQRCSITSSELLSSSEPYSWALPKLHCICAWSRALWSWILTCWLAFQAWLWTYSIITELIGNPFASSLLPSDLLCYSCLEVVGFCLWPYRHCLSVTCYSWLAFLSVAAVLTAYSQQLIYCRLLNYYSCIFR